VWKSIVLAVILNALKGVRFVLVVEWLFVGDAWTGRGMEDAGNALLTWETGVLGNMLCVLVRLLRRLDLLVDFDLL
jgi:hypothetical protein